MTLLVLLFYISKWLHFVVGCKMEEENDVSCDDPISELSKEWPLPSPQQISRQGNNSLHAQLGKPGSSKGTAPAPENGIRLSQSAGYFGSEARSQSTAETIRNGFSNLIIKPFYLRKKNSQTKSPVSQNSLPQQNISKCESNESSVDERANNKLVNAAHQEKVLPSKQSPLQQRILNYDSSESSVNYDLSSALSTSKLKQRIEKLLQDPLLRQLPSGSSVDDYDNRTSLDYQQISASKNRSSENSRQLPLPDTPTLYVPCQKDTAVSLSSCTSINSSENVSLRQGLSVDMLFCPVCFDTAMYAVEFNCAHIFCGQCFVRCLAYHANWLSPVPCPYCRQDVHTVTPRFTEEESKDGPDKQVLLYEIEGYNRKFGACCSSLGQCLVALPRLLWRLAVRFNLGEIVFHALMARLVVSTVMEIYDMRNDILESSVDFVADSLVRSFSGTAV